MATCTIIFSDTPTKGTDVNVTFDPPIENLREGDPTTGAQRMGWMFVQAMAETEGCPEASVTGENDNGDEVTVGMP